MDDKANETVGSYLTTRDEHYTLPEAVVYMKQVLDGPATLAKELLERWGMVAGMPDGEDSAGRAKVRLATPDELVGRALTVAELFYAQAAARGHTVQLADVGPLVAEMQREKAERKAAKEARSAAE